MKTILHKASDRGYANHGWLDTYHSFSFGHYHDPEKLHFGALRVLNDDTVQGGNGFGKHPHDNMEIVTIPLYGDLKHEDSTGRKEVIRQYDVQIMSAGKGIAHSEVNANPDKDVQLLQIWVIPKERNITPRYEQKSFRPEDRINKFQVVVAPDNSEGVFINQDAWFSLGNLQEGFTTEYKLNKQGNGVYAFLIEGQATINGIALQKRDAVGISERDLLEIKAVTASQLLLIEVPMELDPA